MPSYGDIEFLSQEAKKIIGRCVELPWTGSDRKHGPAPQRPVPQPRGGPVDRAGDEGRGEHEGEPERSCQRIGDHHHAGLEPIGAPVERQQLMTEIGLASEALKAQTGCDKLNVAALGNVVPQLHVHVIARFKTDAAWPRPVWGTGPARAYAAEAKAGLVAALRERLFLAD